MTELTPFQILCERKATELVQSYGRQLEDRRVGQVVGEVQPDIFVAGLISGTDVTIYIYEDGAEFTSDRVDVRFEKPDYDTAEKLVAAFIARLTQYLDMRAAQGSDDFDFMGSQDSYWLGDVVEKLRTLFSFRRRDLDK